MNSYIVAGTQHISFEVEVRADSASQAQDLVETGQLDYLEPISEDIEVWAVRKL